MLALQAFSTGFFCFFLMWERKESKSFDVTADHAQTMPSCHALDYYWGEHHSGEYPVPWLGLVLVHMLARRQLATFSIIITFSY